MRQLQSRTKRWRRSSLLLFAVLLIIAGIYVLFKKDIVHAPGKNSPPPRVAPQTLAPQTPPFNKSLYSIEDPASIWLVVNKTRKLPAGFVPSGLVAPNVALRFSGTNEQMKMRQDAATALEGLFASAKSSSYNLLLYSGYRSEAFQNQVYSSYVKRDGQAKADTFSARPGYSEHQTGLSVDLSSSGLTCAVETCFGDSPEGKWLAAHAHEHGFIIRYPEGKQSVTGYQYEPWHTRYVGKELAEEISKTGQTLEEFFALPPAADYR